MRIIRKLLRNEYFNGNEVKKVAGLIGFNRELWYEWKMENKKMCKDLGLIFSEGDGYSVHNQDGDLIKHTYSTLELNKFLMCLTK